MFGLIPYDRRRNQMQRDKEDQVLNVDRLFENFFNDTIFPSYYTRSSYMKVDIGETEDEYWLEAELPGVKKEQINIAVDDGQLTISVEQEEETEDSKENYLRRERYCCSMKRSFSLENIAQDKITAKLENGILRLGLPKTAPEKKVVKNIEIK